MKNILIIISALIVPALCFADGEVKISQRDQLAISLMSAQMPPVGFDEPKETFVRFQKIADGILKEIERQQKEQQKIGQ